jgi:hypothetical protein
MAEGIVAEGAVLEVNTGTQVTPVWTPIIERSQLQNTKSGAAIDMTSFDDEGFTGRRPGLRSMALTANGNYVPSDTGYAALETAWLDGLEVDVRALWKINADGDQTGWRFDAVVTNLSENGQVGGKVELGLSFESNGRPVKVDITAY